MFNILRNFREVILISIFLIDIALAFVLYFDFSMRNMLYTWLETLLSIIVISYSFFLSKLLTTSEERDYHASLLHQMHNNLCVLVDRHNNLTVLNDNLPGLSFADKGFEQLHDILGKEWDAIIMEAYNPSFAGSQHKGRFQYVINGEERYFEYWAYMAKYQSILLRIEDITQNVSQERELSQLMQNYRLMSYELSMIFDAIPVPIWVRDAGGSGLVYYNRQYEHMAKKIGAVEGDGSLKEICRFEMSNPNRTKIKTKFIIDDEPHTFELHSIQLGTSQHRLAVLINATRVAEMESVLEVLREAASRFSTIQKFGVIILDAAWKVVLYNRAFNEIFHFDDKWLTAQPAFSSVLDKMREQGMLPEIKDYRQYKAEQLQQMRGVKGDIIETSYLTGGATLKVHKTHMQSGGMIITYDYQDAA
jgi:transcriptional regulator with PAS, ATPase and Fis domain